MSLLCTRNQVLKGLWRQKMVLKIFLKLFFQKDLEVSKTCLTFAPAFDDKRTANGSRKKSLKIFSKRFGSLEKLPYLCNRFPLLKSERETERLIDFGLEIQIRSLRYLSS